MFISVDNVGIENQAIDEPFSSSLVEYLEEEY